MKKLYTLLLAYFLLVNLPSTFAQTGQWTWLRGSKVSGSAGSHGTLGVPSPSNDPPALYEAIQWTDMQGNFWLYGGLSSAGNCNDLWKYDVTSNVWVWINGTNTVADPGNYGSKGVPSASNRPPAKSWGAASWVDLNGNFWMFGGLMNGGYNDLWKYDVGTNTWTWMNGSNTTGATGVYGTQGVPNAANTPGGRWECVTAWTDAVGDLWLFGGYNFSGGFNDLWRYHIASNTWTWMSGSSSYNQAGIYGTRGVEAPANIPGARMAYAHWMDNTGNMWIFAGENYNGSYFFNDLWRYNPASGNWAWMNGSNTNNQVGIYGNECTPSAINTPGARMENRACWTDKNGNFWSFGGGHDADFVPIMNDLWMYCVQTNQWTWEKGDTTGNGIGAWGTMGVPSPANKPSARAGSVSWTSQQGRLYMFGGTVAWPTSINDLWVFDINDSCGNCASVVSPVASFQASDTVLCTNDCISFTNYSINATSYQWTFNGALPDSSTDKNPQSVCYLAEGIFDVKLVAYNSGKSDSVTITNYINVKSSPATPSITQVGSTLYCTTDSTYISYQWFDSTKLINGATDTFLVVSHSGNYNVQVTNANGCKVAVGINIVLGYENPFSSGSDNVILLFPNPANGELRIKNAELRINEIDVYNALGEKLQSFKREAGNENQETIIDVSNLSSGIYFLQILTESGSKTKMFVKE